MPLKIVIFQASMFEGNAAESAPAYNCVYNSNTLPKTNS